LDNDPHQPAFWQADAFDFAAIICILCDIYFFETVQGFFDELLLRQSINWYWNSIIFITFMGEHKNINSEEGIIQNNYCIYENVVRRGKL
jgi:hypothetical protein